MWIYQAPNGKTLTITDANLKNIFEREGFTLVQPETKVVKLKKAK